MNRTIHRRLADLQAQALADAGCETCRHYPGIVLMDDAGNHSRAETCPDCGRHVAITCEVHIVGVPLDLL